MKYERINVFKASLIIAAATFVSRILGFLRDLMIVWFFGGTFFSDAFFAAMRIPETFRKLSSEGSLSASLISFYTGILKKNDNLSDAAASSFRAVLFTVVPVVIICILAAPLLMKLIAGGFNGDYEKFMLTVNLSKIMFPYLIFVSLSAVSMGLLNSKGHFLTPALSPVMLNITIISSLLTGFYFKSDVAVYTAIGVSLGGMMQVLIQIYPLKRMKLLTLKIKKSGAGAKKAVLRSVGSAFGLSLAQINLLTGTIIATYESKGSVTALYIADRLVQFPISMLASSVSNAFFPAISSMDNKEEINRTYLLCLRLILFLIIPAMVGLIVIRQPLVKTLFNGNISGNELLMVSDTILFYAAGMWIWGTGKITLSVFYSLFGEKVPVTITIVSVFFNILFSLVLLSQLKVSGIALSSTISGTISLFSVCFFLGRRNGTDFSSIVLPSCKIILNSAIMGISTFIISESFNFECSLELRAGKLILIVVSGVLIYIISSYLTGSYEMSAILSFKKDINDKKI